MPAYEKQKEVRAKLEAYQILHEQMNEAFRALWQLQLFLFLSFGCVLIFSTAEKALPFEEINRFSQMEWKQTVLQLDEELSRATAVRSVRGGKALEYVSDQGRVVTMGFQKELRSAELTISFYKKQQLFRVGVSEAASSVKRICEKQKIHIDTEEGHVTLNRN